MVMLIPEQMTLSERYSTIIYRYCMYCKRFMGIKNGGGMSGTSHSICIECQKGACHEQTT